MCWPVRRGGGSRPPEAPTCLLEAAPRWCPEPPTVKSGRPSRSPIKKGAREGFLAAFALMALAGTAAKGQPVPAPDPQTLILEVRLNGVRSPLLWQFELLSDGSLA